ncbi:hypothetical protein ABPG77_010741 [Micractinium sp. CCAP 211/92]
MLLQRCTTLVSLRAFRPLLGAWSLPSGPHPLSTDVDPEAGLAALLAAAEAESQQLAAAGAPFDGDAKRPWADSEVPADQQRLLQAGVVGVPNAGKSTLVNALVGTKVSAVSPKTNTTEQMRLGAFTSGVSQVVLYDTPGVVGKEHYKNPAHQRRVRGAWTAAGDCDLLLFLVDAARELQRADPRIARLLADSASPQRLGMPADWQPPPAVLVLNKVDAVPRPDRKHLLPLADRLRQLRQFEDVFFISAKKGTGLPELREYLLHRATPGEWTLDADQATDRGEEEQALEVVREKLFLRLYKELPYACQLRLGSCLPLHDGSMRIEIDILVPHEGAKHIVIGSAGAGIAFIHDHAQADLQRMWGRPVDLLLRVGVAKK